MKKLVVILFMGLALSGTAMAEAPDIMDYYAPAMDKMHTSMMDMHATGDADVDFVRNMIPHHQAAIDMSKIELQYGKDPEIRKLAADIMTAQETEIKTMNAWLSAHQKK